SLRPDRRPCRGMGRGILRPRLCHAAGKRPRPDRCGFRGASPARRDVRPAEGAGRPRHPRPDAMGAGDGSVKQPPPAFEEKARTMADHGLPPHSRTETSPRFERTVRTSACAAILLLSSFLSASAAEKLSVVLDWFVNPDHTPLVIAKEGGYFMKHGL